MNRTLGQCLAALLILHLQPTALQVPDNRLRSPLGIALAEQARALPPEFRSDTLLRLAASSLTADEKWKVELIEEAFWAGGRSPLPYLQRADDWADSLITNEVRANGLEALTLQTASVDTMLGLDAQTAMRLFESIAYPNPRQFSCSDPAAPDVSAYYRTAGRVFERGFATDQRRNGDDLHFLLERIAVVRSPSQVPPALKLIFAAKLGLSQRDNLLGVLASALYSVSLSDRAFGASEPALVAAVDLDQLDSSGASVLLPALRAYIVRSVTAKRCTENLPAAGKNSPSVDAFNAMTRRLDPDAERWKPILASEAVAAGDDGTYPKNRLWRSPQSSAVQSALRWLTHGNRVRDGEGQPWTLDERSRTEWTAHYDDAWKLVDDWTADDEPTPQAFFVMKSDTLMTFAVFVPPGPARDSAMQSYLAFLEQNYAMIPNRNLWFTEFRHMLYTARFSDDAVDKLWILEQMARSSNPVIALYAKLESAIGPPDRSFPER